MRVVAQDVAVVAGAWLALIGIADRVLLHRCIARHEAPFHTDRKGRATSATQSGVLDLLDDFLARGHLGQDLLPGLIAADAPIGLERPGPLVLQRFEAGQISLVVPGTHLSSAKSDRPSRAS